ncbi:hypothetical protein SAMN05216241_11813 [Limimonas halophila]|uniref:Aminoglycoside phosphotransferase domain-containing protein n=1 Tax=Limimonas halophila TaxID=1082479 RepID=A0A1G7V0K4_9PROT|nr:bifunctional aminoglycoside phosphotransferase/ATP-binding protein [Limimonas halophila]SDG52490.1 hypothetical protein SAMN05216241_11813 [Limimonas halophila]
MSSEDAQTPVVTLLGDAGTYGASGPVAYRRTHISHIFLVGERAYKLKRAVAFAFVDFTALAERRAACAAELTRNRRTAPELYLGVCPILRDSTGVLRLGELMPDGPAEPAAGTVVDWVVVMRRFDEDQLLATVANRGDLDAATVDALAEGVARFHAEAEPVAGGGTAMLAGVVSENDADLRAQPGVFAPTAVDALTRDTRIALARVAGRLDWRAASGLVRRCHGDLHLGNVVLLNGEPRPFDAIEFSDRLACIDVGYDLAFLLMDLDRRGLRPWANRLLTRYLEARDDLGALAALPVFLSLRAAIRAKVGAAAPDADGARLRGLFEAARAYLRPPGPRLLAVGGVSGTGKTTLARRLAPDVGAVPGAVVVRSDVERKKLFGVGETEPLPESAYQGRANARTYDRMLERARAVLATGHSAVIEATFLRREDRRRASKLAEDLGVPFAGLWLTGDPEVLCQRVAARSGDASDATPEVVRGQLQSAPQGPTAWREVDASGDADATEAAARAGLVASSDF